MTHRRSQRAGLSIRNLARGRLLEKRARLRSLLLAGLVFGLTLAAAPTALALSPTASFSLTPSTLTQLANTNLTISTSFNYLDSQASATDSAGDKGPAVCAAILASGGQCDQLQTAAITLAPGLSLETAGSPSYCTLAQLSANGCPAASKIGSGSSSLIDYTPPSYYTTSNAALFVYAMAPGSGAIGGLGIYVNEGTYPGAAGFAIPGAITVNSSGQDVITLSPLPTKDNYFSSSFLQLTGLSFALSTTSNGYSVATNPGVCVSAVSALTSSTREYPTVVSHSSAYTPTGCSSATFGVTPSSTAYGANPTLTLANTFAYVSSDASPTGSQSTSPATCAAILSTVGPDCDQLQSATITLAPGLSINPKAPTSVCTSAQLTANACPPASRIGSGTSSLVDYTVPSYFSTSTAALIAYAMAPTGSASEDIGLYVGEYGSTGPGFVITGTISTNSSGQDVIALTQVAKKDNEFGSSFLQLTGYTLALNGTVDGTPYISNYAACSAAVSTFGFSTTDFPTAPALSSTFTPTACPTTATFGLSPSVSTHAANPTLTLANTFSYVDSDASATDSSGHTGPDVCEAIIASGGSCDQLTSFATTLAPGLTLKPSAVTTVCSSAQLTAGTCPAASQLGSGNASYIDYLTPPTYSIANGALANVYAMAPTAGAIEGIGIAVGTLAVPLFTISGEVTTNASGQDVITFKNVPETDNTWGGQLQITALSTVLNGTVNGKAYVSNPTSCSAASSTFSFATVEYPVTAPLTLSSAFTPTGC